MSRSRNQIILLGLTMLAIGLGLVSIIWSRFVHSEKILLLPESRAAHWILYPKPPSGLLHKSVPLTAEFRRDLVLESVPANAQLTIQALKRYSICIDGKILDQNGSNHEMWKDERAFDVSHCLHSGTNELLITVENDEGPPLLRLSLQTEKAFVTTDQSWSVSLAGSAQVPARLASSPPELRPGNPLYGGEHAWPSLIKRIPTLLFFALMATLMLWLISRLLPGKELEQRNVAVWNKMSFVVFGLAASFLVVLFFNNLRFLPASLGFDASSHIEYIDYVRNHWSLPLATQGWQMYQPPLYYFISACALSPLQSATAGDTAIGMLRFLGMLILLSQLTFNFLSLRILFPNRIGAQIFGTVLAALLPENIYICHFVTNEGLSAALVSGAIYFCLRLLRGDPRSPILSIALGLFLGAALLTKVTALVALPLIFIALAAAVIIRRDFSLRSWACKLGLSTATCALVCGWYYWRTWKHFGSPLVGNWDVASGFHWWMEDGFRTSDYYLRLGACFNQPFFSGYNGFFDGIYSTLWGDGLYGGMVMADYRPPWNYELMAANFLLAIIPSMLIIAGIILAIRQGLKFKQLQWLLMVTITLVVLLAIVHMSLKLPSYGQVKSFYGLIAMLPICAFGALGWNFLQRQKRIISIPIAIAFGTWAITSYASFWVRSWSSETYFTLGVNQAHETRHADAAANYTRALQISPQDVRAQSLLAVEMFQSGRVDEARQLVEATCKQHPDNFDSMYLLATIQFAQKDPKAAIDLAKRAGSLAPDHFFLWTSLCQWQVTVGEFQEAMATARQGLRVNPFDEELHSLFGTALMKLSDPTNAVAHFRYATALKPDSAEFHRQLAAALKSMGDFKEAIKEQEISVHLKPDQPDLLIELATLYTHENRDADAIKCYQSARDLNPFFMPARKGLAWLLATSPDPSIRKGKKALQIAKEACDSAKHEDPSLEIVFAAAQAEEGLFQEAASTANKALALIEVTKEKQLIPLAEELLACFRSGQACHQETAASRNFLKTP